MGAVRALEAGERMPFRSGWTPSRPSVPSAATRLRRGLGVSSAGWLGVARVAVGLAVLVGRRAGCFALRTAQRRLSTPVRQLRRRTVSVSGEQRLTNGHVVELTAARRAAPLDAALAATSLAIVLLACAAVVAHV